jgi:hypothetical protein
MADLITLISRVRAGPRALREGGTSRLAPAPDELPASASGAVEGGTLTREFSRVRGVDRLWSTYVQRGMPVRKVDARLSPRADRLGTEFVTSSRSGDDV